MHAGAKDSQSSFSTERIIAGENDGGIWPDQSAHDQSGEQLPEMVDVPHGLAEESVVVREMAVGGGVAGDNQIGDIAMSSGQNPASLKSLNVAKPGSVKTGANVRSRISNELVSSMSAASVPKDLKV